MTEETTDKNDRRNDNMLLKKRNCHMKIKGAVGRRGAPKVPFALKPVKNTKGACGAFRAAGASSAVWETSWGVWFFLGPGVVIALA